MCLVHAYTRRIKVQINSYMNTEIFSSVEVILIILGSCNVVPDQCRLIGNEGYEEVVCDCSGSGYTGDLCTEGKLDLGISGTTYKW